MTADEQRPSDVARRQALVREVNDRALDSIEGGSGEMTILCECGATACATELTVHADVFRTLRVKPSQFMVMTGHQAHALDRVLRRLGGITIVQSTYVGEPT